MMSYLAGICLDNLVNVLATLNLTLATGSLANFSTTGNIVSMTTSCEHTSTNN